MVLYWFYKQDDPPDQGSCDQTAAERHPVCRKAVLPTIKFDKQDDPLDQGSCVQIAAERHPVCRSDWVEQGCGSGGASYVTINIPRQI